MKEKNKKRILSFAFLSGSFVFSLLFLIFYLNFGSTIFHPEIETNVIVATSITMAILLAGILFPSKLTDELSFLISFLAFLFYINSQLTLITNVFVSIDGTTFSAGFIFNFLFGVLALAFALTASILEEKILPTAFRFAKKEDEIHVKE